MNLHSGCMKAPVVKEFVVSISIAVLHRQVSRLPNLFTSFQPSLTGMEEVPVKVCLLISLPFLITCRPQRCRQRTHLAVTDLTALF